MKFVGLTPIIFSTLALHVFCFHDLAPLSNFNGDKIKGLHLRIVIEPLVEGEGVVARRDIPRARGPRLTGRYRNTGSVVSSHFELHTNRL